jgi:flagellar biosynthesis anti-sigma factor FlgM
LAVKILVKKPQLRRRLADILIVKGLAGTGKASLSGEVVMKITNNNQNISPILRTNETAEETRRDVNKSSSQAHISAGDRVDVSKEAYMKASVHKAMEAVNAEPDVDWTRVSKLKQDIANGAYRPDTDVLAQRMLEDELFLSLF